MSSDFDGKIAVVTGGAMGIGKACALAFVEGGGKVVIGDIDEEAGSTAAQELGSSALFQKTDVRLMDDVQALGDVAIERFGGIDIWVNNAALGLRGTVDKITEDDWQQVIDINLTGYWRGMAVAVAAMRKRGGGSIVNVSSVQSLLGFEGYAGYAAAKGGVDSLTKQTAVELAPIGIRVNAISPGTIMTPLNEKLFASMDDPTPLIDSWNKAHPLGRFGEAHEVAELVAFLASDRSSFMTGDIIRVDGGLAVKGA